MTISDYRALIAKLTAEGRLATPAAPAFSDPLRHATSIGYCLNLADEYKAARALDAKALSVFADVLVIPGDSVFEVKAPLRIISIAARQILVDGNPATVDLPYDDKATLQPVVRVIADEMEGEFRAHPIGVSAAPQSIAAAPPNLPLQFHSYSRAKDGLVRNQGKLPMDLLDMEAPLYQLASGSFDVAAGAMRDCMKSASMAGLARSIFKWLVRWSTYPSPYLARLFEDSEALADLSPDWRNPTQVVYSIPSQTPEVYRQLAESQCKVAEKYELDESFQGVHNDLKQVTGRLVAAWIARDTADLNDLESEIDAARDLVTESRTNVKKAMKHVADQGFATKLQGVQFDVDQAKDRLMTIVKGCFQILTAVVEVGVSIATMIPDTKGLKDVLSLGGSMISSQQSLRDKALTTVEMAYAVPKMLLNEFERQLAKSGTIGKGLEKLVPAIQRLFEVSKKISEIDKLESIGDEIGNMVSETANMADAIESKAVWDSFEVEAVNQLEGIIADSEASSSVKDATLAYKTEIQKYAIANREFAEQQAVLAQRTRELGTLLLRKIAAGQKREALEKLRDELTDEVEIVATLERLRAARLRELHQTFFASYCKYRAAYFYQNLAWPAQLPTAIVPKDVPEMKELLLNIDSALSKVSSPSHGDWNEVLKISKAAESGFFQDLQNEGRARFDITTTANFPHNGLVRLSRARAWLVSSGADRINTELMSGTAFEDRLTSGGTLSFSGTSSTVSFVYEGSKIHFDPSLDGVRPTPFSNWTLMIGDNGQKPDFANITHVEVELIGTALGAK